MSSEEFMKKQQAEEQADTTQMHVYARGAEDLPYMDYGPAPPESYGTDAVEVLPIEPGRLFAYWDLSGPAGGEALQGDQSGRRWVLRGYGEESGAVWDTDIDVYAGNFYVQVQGEKNYRFEIGYISEGRFHRLARSRPLTLGWRGGTPPTPSGTAPAWAHVKRDVGPQGVIRSRRMPHVRGIGGKGIPGLSWEATRERIEAPSFSALLGRSLGRSSRK